MSKLLLNISRTGEIKVILIGNGKGSRIKLLRGFEKYIEPELPILRGQLKLRLAIAEISK